LFHDHKKPQNPAKPGQTSQIELIRAARLLRSLNLKNIQNLAMAPLPTVASVRVLLARGVLAAVPRIALSSSAPTISPRGLSVNKTQSVTLGIMAVYVVVIALLWNIPFVRWSLWPFKVRAAASCGMF
jgi:hypothetical protein